VGTIFGELLARKPMFPAHNYDHLIRLQTRTLGSPSEENLQWVTREKARTFMRSLPQYPRRDFKGYVRVEEGRLRVTPEFGAEGMDTLGNFALC